ncbi:MAG: hypothetical protein EBS96_10315 [Spartobacteria bacterium]|nr:hypothetical protein [Spartobacteria bacterium]
MVNILSTIECRGRRDNEQPKVGPKGERLGRSESSYADFRRFYGIYQLNASFLICINLRNLIRKLTLWAAS